MNRITIAGLALLVVLGVIGSASLFTVSQTEQVLVVQFGKVERSIEDPGLHAKWPIAQNIITFDKRLLAVELPGEEVILGDQRRLIIDTFTVFRIVDPLRFYQALRTDEQARAQLSQIVSSSMRRELGRVSLAQLLTPERTTILNNVRDEVAAKSQPLGVEIDEVRFHRADLPFETSQAIYDRMKSERQREAKELRAQGFEWAQQIQSKADRERTAVLSDAQRDATISRGQGDAEASRLLSDAFARDETFYKFYRSVQSYKRSLADANATLLLTPTSAFLQLLTSGPQPPAPAPK